MGDNDAAMPVALKRMRPSVAELARQATLPDVLYVVLLAIASGYVAAFLVVALFRLSYPFPLEVTEGAALREVHRILQGQPLYVAPSLQYVPFIYGPVFFYSAAFLAMLTGESYLPLRLVSLLASIGSILLIAQIVKRETGSFGAAAISAGLFAASYPFSGTTSDLGRVDALFTFFLIAGVYVTYSETNRGRRRWSVLVASGCLIGLAGLSKVPTGAALVALALLVYLVATARGRGLAFLGGLVITIGAIVLLLSVQSGPWPTWYLWNLPSAHDIEGKFLGRMWFGDLLPRLTLPLLLGPVFVLAHALKGNLRPLLFYGLVMPALLGVTWASRSNAGAALNVLLPAFSVLAILLGVGLHETLCQIGSGSVRARAFQTYVLAACIVQFLLLAYNPRLVVPYRSEQWAAERLATRVQALPGDVFAPGLAGYLQFSERDNQPYPSALGELTGAYGGDRNPEGVRWFAALREALLQRKYQYVVVPEVEPEIRGAVLSGGYIDAGPLFPPDDEFWLWKTSLTPEYHLFTSPTV